MYLIINIVFFFFFLFKNRLCNNILFYYLKKFAASLYLQAFLYQDSWLFCMNCRLRFIPENLLLFNGDSLKIILNFSSVRSSQSSLVKFNISGIGVKSLSATGFENLFHGHTSFIWGGFYPLTMSNSSSSQPYGLSTFLIKASIYMKCYAFFSLLLLQCIDPRASLQGFHDTLVGRHPIRICGLAGLVFHHNMRNYRCFFLA